MRPRTPNKASVPNGCPMIRTVWMMNLIFKMRVLFDLASLMHTTWINLLFTFDLTQLTLREQWLHLPSIAAIIDGFYLLKMNGTLYQLPWLQVQAPACMHAWCVGGCDADVARLDDDVLCKEVCERRDDI
jgi:hypothetical protein